jgi:hypothetical protein
MQDGRATKNGTNWHIFVKPVHARKFPVLFQTPPHIVYDAELFLIFLPEIEPPSAI